MWCCRIHDVKASYKHGLCLFKFSRRNYLQQHVCPTPWPSTWCTCIENTRQSRRSRRKWARTAVYVNRQTFRALRKRCRCTMCCAGEDWRKRHFLKGTLTKRRRVLVWQRRNWPADNCFLLRAFYLVVLSVYNAMLVTYLVLRSHTHADMPVLFMTSLIRTAVT